MRRAASAGLLALAAAGAAGALEVTGTVPAAVKGAAKADFTLSGITVKGVSWEGGAVVLPVTQVKDRAYIDVKILSRALYAKLEKCFTAGCPGAAKAPPPAVKVESVKPLKSESRVANAEVSFGGDLLLVLGVMSSYREPGTFWVAFPGSVEFRDPALKASAEKAVKESWLKSSSGK